MKMIADLNRADVIERKERARKKLAAMSFGEKLVAVEEMRDNFSIFSSSSKKQVSSSGKLPGSA